MGSDLRRICVVADVVQNVPLILIDSLWQAGGSACVKDAGDRLGRNKYVGASLSKVSQSRRFDDRRAAPGQVPRQIRLSVTADRNELSRRAPLQPPARHT